MLVCVIKEHAVKWTNTTFGFSLQCERGANKGADNTHVPGDTSMFYATVLFRTWALEVFHSIVMSYTYTLPAGLHTVYGYSYVNTPTSRYKSLWFKPLKPCLSGTRSSGTPVYSRWKCLFYGLT